MERTRSGAERERSGPGRRRGATARLAAAGLLLAGALSGCLARSDAVAPMVAIREPKAGTTRTTQDLRIVGYAMDDSGIQEIRVDGTDLLDFDVYRSERGKRFVEFAFTIPDLTDGETTTRIVATDVHGRQTTLLHTLTIDTTPPTLELTSVTTLGDGRTRIEGVARDDVAVSAIRIDGAPLQFVPAPEHRFSIDVALAADAEIEVEDSAGNTIRRPLP